MCSVPCLWSFFCCFLNKLEEGSQISCQSSFCSLLIVWDTLAQKATFQNSLSRLCFKPGLWPVSLKTEGCGPITLVTSTYFAEGDPRDWCGFAHVHSIPCLQQWHAAQLLQASVWFPWPPTLLPSSYSEGYKTKELSRLCWEMDGRVWSWLNNSERIEMPCCIMESFCKAMKQFPHPNDPIFKSIQLSVRICNNWN